MAIEPKGQGLRCLQQCRHHPLRLPLGPIAAQADFIMNRCTAFTSQSIQLLSDNERHKPEQGVVDKLTIFVRMRNKSGLVGL